MYAPAKVTLLALAVLSLTTVVRSHVSVALPCVPNSDYEKCKGYGKQDDNLAAPTGEAYSFEDKKDIVNLGGGVCRSTIPTKNAGAWTAGKTETPLMANHGTHKFGHCQWSVSYNGGKTFAVFDSTFDNCLSESDATNNDNGKKLFNINVKVPSNLPAKKNAIVSWTWNGRSDFRELFWNCMMLDIVNSNSPASFTAVPVALFNFVFTSGGKKYAYVLPDMAGNKKNFEELYTGQPKITVTADGKVTGGDGGIFPVVVEGKKGDKLSASQAVFISEKTLPKPLSGGGAGASRKGTETETSTDSSLTDSSDTSEDSSTSSSDASDDPESSDTSSSSSEGSSDSKGDSQEDSSSEEEEEADKKKKKSSKKSKKDEGNDDE
ncbi:hypothetical protein IWQ60_002557 [Tieghemiomyces parasiticus]|uniref:Chitin-binding type-4 domain-containing protein n=1 Tax=Tieghemiomyces parasiticus TaxID=78921 RepID=A0A9W8ACG5_9FUNG|nr:hypothetical protein IWQ60_002557 [Tieghemiomyces parasiticus]